MNNYRLGMPLSAYVNSAIRHSIKASQGWDAENHATMAAWNWLCFIETREMVRRGILPAELNGIDNWLTEEGANKALDGIRRENEACLATLRAEKPVTLRAPVTLTDRIANALQAGHAFIDCPRVEPIEDPHGVTRGYIIDDPNEGD